MILAFLRNMIDSVQSLQGYCCNLLSKIPNDEDYSSEYIYSSFFMFSETRKMIEDGKTQLEKLSEKFTYLWGMYSDILRIPLDQHIVPPRPTAIFLSVPQYNRIFVRIHQWFSFGIYNFSKEHFMLSFIKISALYESYLLAKFLCYFRDRGYSLESSRRCVYPVSKRWKYKNTSVRNTFVLKNGQKRITLYYQPVIFDTDQRSVNGIGLYRNNSIGFITGNDYALQMRIWQMLGYIFACDTDGKVFFLLQGVSNSGKSVLLELLRSMFNPEAVSTLDLYRLGDRFSGAALIEKKLNICGDLPNRTLSAQAVATLKQITGRDLMTVEEKYKPLATMAPAINLVFASNFPIRMAEEDTALLSRMVVIPFRFSIPTEQQDHLLTQKILAERDGIFLRAIHAYHRLLADKYIFAGQALVDQLLSQSYASPMSENQNIAAFLNDCCILTGDNSFTSTQDLHEACTAYCVGHDLPIITDRTRFSRILRSQLANKVKPKKIRIGDKTHNGYIGIKLSNQ